MKCEERIDTWQTVDFVGHVDEKGKQQAENDVHMHYYYRGKRFISSNSADCVDLRVSHLRCAFGDAKKKRL